MVRFVGEAAHVSMWLVTKRSPEKAGMVGLAAAVAAVAALRPRCSTTVGSALSSPNKSLCRGLRGRA